jgi:ribosomal protein S12 methylthiotransferase
MKTQEKISQKKLKAKVGKRMQVIVDQPGVGRSMADAPEIDGVVKFKGGKQGEFVEVLIDRADAHDLFGRLA